MFDPIGKLLKLSPIIAYASAPYRYERARSSRLLIVPAESNPESFLIAKSAIQRARPTNGNAASVNSLVALVRMPTSSSRNPSRDPVHVSSSVAVAYSVRIAPQPYARADSAPLAIANPAAGSSRSLAFTLLGFLTSSRPLQPARTATAAHSAGSKRPAADARV